MVDLGRYIKESIFHGRGGALAPSIDQPHITPGHFSLGWRNLTGFSRITEKVVALPSHI